MLLNACYLYGLQDDAESVPRCIRNLPSNAQINDYYAMPAFVQKRAALTYDVIASCRMANAPSTLSLQCIGTIPQCFRVALSNGMTRSIKILRSIQKNQLAETT
eukprot:3388359-Amphidinium_carterae.1